MNHLICIAGPTGSGKTAVAIEVAERLHAQIISVDSRQVYRGFAIGTAQPTTAESSRIPHHLVGFADANTPLTAGEFANIARAKIRELIAANVPVVLAGGSGLYFKALFDGLFKGPEIDQALRDQLRERAKIEGVEKLHAELAACDPTLAEKIPPRDYPRIERALEVYLISGKPLSDWWKDGTGTFEFSPRYYVLKRDRKDIMERIAGRARIMMKEGWLDEVRALLQQGYGDAIEVGKFHGYRELAAHLRGDMSLEDAIERIIIVTRQYAKRQMTWFRHTENVRWIDVASETSAVETAQSILQMEHSHE